MKLKDKLWNWGHLEGSHNGIVKEGLKMTPEEFAREFGIERAFIVSYGGNITPPFTGLAKRFSVLKEVKWSVLGDASTPLPEAELGNTEDILECLDVAGNITGGVVDDFFSEDRMKRFPPAVLKKIKKRLNDAGLDFWCVLYNHQLNNDLSEYLDCFDGITFWLWGCEHIVNAEALVEKFFDLTRGKKTMLGVYLWDYKDVGKQPMDGALFEKQLAMYFDLLRTRLTEGIIFCSSAVGDAGLETTAILKKYIEKHGDEEI